MRVQEPGFRRGFQVQEQGFRGEAAVPYIYMYMYIYIYIYIYIVPAWEERTSVCAGEASGFRI